jgi:Icc protein
VRIVQMSDIHVGSTFVPDLMVAAIEEINDFGPHLVAIPGDLTTKGYREEFKEAKAYLDRLECENVVVVPGNHDSHNVGYYHFEDLFGKRERSLTLSVPEGEAKVVALDSSEPDLDEGQVGREHYGWLDSEFRGWDRGPKILVIHHHLLDLPGTGRDRNILRDAGDILAILRELEVELVLSGHRHVPYVHNVSNTLIIYCGTVSSTRVRDSCAPPTTGLNWMGTRSRLPCATQAKARRHSLVALGGRWRTSFFTRPTSDTFATTGYLPKTNF